MKNFSAVHVFVFFLVFAQKIFAQYPEPKINEHDPALPAWVKMMYDDGNSVHSVDSAYEAYYQNHEMKETVYTRWYMRWRRYVSPFLDENGYVHFPSSAEIDRQLERRNQLQSGLRSVWTFAGPQIHFTHKNTDSDPVVPISEHANVYCVDRSLSNAAVLFAGSESGGVYKSVDSGNSWSMVTHDLLVFDVKCVKIHPSNENVVLFGSAGKIYKTTDGGITWVITGDANFQSQNIYTWDLYFNPADPNIVYAGTNYGLYRSTDEGDNWTQIFPGQCMSVMVKPDDASVIYALQYDAATKIPYFYKSIDSGATFTEKPQGWFEVPAVDLGKIESDGGRIAVSIADPLRVYVLLVGNSQSNSNLQLGGYIGIYVSHDAGETWTLPQAYLGMPYDVNTAPDLMDFDGHTGDYNQDYYNTYIAASQLNADRIIMGGLNMWRSDDGAATYQPVGGYIGSLALMHVDQQSIKSYKMSDTTEEVWWSSDGGVNHSTDFLQTHESKCNGIYATELWGFDQGWNEDIMVGGRYHNGNMGHAEGFPQGEFISLGGGEAATGYADYSDERKTFFSDIGAVVLPEQIDGITHYTGASGQPNESYYNGESSRIIFDNDNYHIAYMGKDNKVYKSVDGGSSYITLYEFGNVTSNKIIWIEQSRVNTNVIYAQQFVGNKSVIWKTTDGGTTWNQITLPFASQKYLSFSLSASDENEMWLSYMNTGNGFKVYHTNNSGSSWTNLTTSMLDNLNIWSIANQFGTDGGVYVAAKQGVVLYRNNSMSDWSVVGSGLPAVSEPLRIVPFYKAQKIRLATWHVGVWENDFYEPSTLMADFAIGNHIIYCAGDTIYFSDHSVASANATYQWNFPGGNPSSSNEKNPRVIFPQPDIYDVTLIVTDGGVSDTITKSITIDGITVEPLPVTEGFESGSFDSNWLLTNWALSETVGGYSTSTHCMYYDNYDIDLQGNYVDVHTAKYNLTNLADARLTFDVAYAPYGYPYDDTLEVLASTDCAQTFSLVYKKGGDDLSTYPGNNGNYFTPADDQWRTDTVSLDAFTGNSEVVLAFRNIGKYGNVLYVDNINLTSPVLIAVNNPATNNAPVVFPNPTAGIFYVKNFSSQKNEFIVTVSNCLGKEIFSERVSGNASFNLCPIDLSRFGKGVYFVKLETAGDFKYVQVAVQ